jgi:metal-responsive CopG/Arc/MetJ family transcriptional regulator
VEGEIAKQGDGLESKLAMARALETIHVVLDARLLRATDRAARRAKLNRSVLIRNALREHLRRLEITELEERDRKGYHTTPQESDESSGWESEAAWPELDQRAV